MMDAIIRKARAGDATQIANVEIQSWCETYRNILPQDDLDQLSLTFEEKKDMWKQAAAMTDRSLFVAEVEGKVVGFSIFCPPRDRELQDYAELGAIYLFEKHQGKGIGFALLSAGMKELIKLKYTKVYCWTIEGNPTIQFYEKSGAVFNGIEKFEKYGGKRVKELCYEWKDLFLFVS